MGLFRNKDTHKALLGEPWDSSNVILGFDEAPTFKDMDNMGSVHFRMAHRDGHYTYKYGFKLETDFLVIVAQGTHCRPPRGERSNERGL